MKRRNWLKTTAVGVLVLFGVKWRPRGMTLAEAVAACPPGGTIHIPQGVWSVSEPITGMRICRDHGTGEACKHVKGAGTLLFDQPNYTLNGSAT